MYWHLQREGIKVNKYDAFVLFFCLYFWSIEQLFHALLILVFRHKKCPSMESRSRCFDASIQVQFKKIRL